MAAFGCTITVEAGKIPSSQSNFVWLAVADNFPTAAKDGGTNSILNGGGNLRCYTDDTKATQLPIEVVTFVTGGTPVIQVWGLSPTLNVASTVYIEADTVASAQPSVGAAFGRNAVWVDREYQYNLFDSSSIIDSTGVSTPTIAGTPSDDQTSPIGGGVRFDVGEYINLNQNLGDTTGDLTLRAWIKVNTSSAFGTIIGLREGATWSYHWRLENLDPAILIGSSSPNSPGANLVIGTWYQLTLTISGTTITYYRDGVSQGTASVSGARALNPSFDAYISSANGIQESLSTLAEISAEFGAISASQVASEYNNQNSPATFWTTSAWVEQVGGDTIAPTGIPSEEAFGTGVITTGAVDIAADGIPSSEAFGTAVLSQATFISPSGIASEEAFGTAVLSTGAVSISPNGIASTEAFGSAAISQATFLTPTGIVSEEAFGSATITTGVVVLSPSGIASEEAFGSHTIIVAVTQDLSPTGIASAEAFGSHVVAVAGAKEIKIDFQDEIVIASNLQSKTLYFNGTNYFTID